MDRIIWIGDKAGLSVMSQLGFGSIAKDSADMSTTNLIDPSMNWMEALTITDAMARQTLINRGINYPEPESAKKL